MSLNKISISYRPMQTGEETGVIQLILNIFTAFVAPAYSKEGIEEFKKFVCPDAFSDRSTLGSIVLLATCEKRIVGVLEMVEDSHIALLFVETAFQRKGIAGELVRRAIWIGKKRNPGIRKITVNSSPNAVAAYQRIGFKRVGNEQVVNGIRFTPLEWGLDFDDVNRA